jgi:hypothetical protein
MRRSVDLVVGLFGARGSGKSKTAKDYLAAELPPRRLIWDTMDEYGDHARAVPSLSAMLKGSGDATFALRYVPRGTDRELAARFGAFCALAYQRGDLMMIVEELQRVTQPSWAPADWSDCTLRGRHRRLAIFGISQRPANVDKNFFSMATFIRSGRLSFPADQRCMAEVLDVPLADVRALVGFDWIGRDMLTGRVSRSTDKKPTLRRVK